MARPRTDSLIRYSPGRSTRNWLNNKTRGTSNKRTSQAPLCAVPQVEVPHSHSDLPLQDQTESGPLVSSYHGVGRPSERKLGGQSSKTVWSSDIVASSAPLRLCHVRRHYRLWCLALLKEFIHPNLKNVMPLWCPDFERKIFLAKVYVTHSFKRGLMAMAALVRYWYGKNVNKLQLNLILESSLNLKAWNILGSCRETVKRRTYFEHTCPYTAWTRTIIVIFRTIFKLWHSNVAWR